jgi:hypothetical protein
MDSHILSAPDLPPTGLQPSSGVEPHGHEVGSSPAPETAKAAPQLQDQIPGYEDEPLAQGPAYRTILAPAAEPTVHAPQVQDRILLSEDQPVVATPTPAAARPPAPVTRAPALELTMPDEAEPDAAPAAVPSIPATRAAQHSTRNVLLATAGALGLTVLLAGGGFYALTHRGGAMSPANTVANTVAMPQAVRPSEALAANQAGLQATNTAKAQPAAQPTGGSPGTTKAATQAHKADAADILGLKSDAPGDASPFASAAAPETAEPGRPAVTPEAPAAGKPVASAAAATPPQASTQAAAAPAPVVHPADAADVAAALVPAPLSSRQVVDVLSVVTEIGALVRDMRNENAQLRTQVATLNDTVANKTMDFEQRLGLAEARGSVAAAMGAGKPQAAAPASVIPAVVTVSGARTLRTMAVTPVSAPARSARDYRVQAASPGLAVLADAGAGPGQAAGLQVSVGDDVPGVGRITSIGQRGSTWVVQTDHGAIQ